MTSSRDLARWGFQTRYAAEATLDVDTSLLSLIPYDRPEWIFWDVGLTLVHPSAEMVQTALSVTFPERSWTAGDISGTLVSAAEARHLRWPLDLTPDERVHRAWAGLLGLPPLEGATVLGAILTRTDLYCEVDPSAQIVLDELVRRGVRLGAISNSDGTLDEELRHFGLESFFTVVVDSGRARVEKPHPAIFRLALEAARTPAASAWHIGDGLINDYLAASAVGMKPILLDRHGTYVGAFPAYRISRLAQLMETRALSGVPGATWEGSR